MPELETPVWTGRGFNPQRGILRLQDNRLRFDLENRVEFEAPTAELRISWPWYGFGCQFWAHVGERRYFISFLHTNNSLYSWWQGVRKGRRWKRAITASVV